MAKDKDLIVQRNKTLARRNGLIMHVDQLRLLASRHVLRKPARRTRPSDRH